MDSAMAAMQGLGASLSPYLPRLIGTLGILLAAWLGARLARGAVQRLGSRSNLDQRVNSPGLSALLADIAGWLVWLLALPALLDALQLKGLLDPVNAMLSRLLGFLPNLMGAAVVLGLGVLLAGILRRIVTGVLTAAGSEALAQRMGLGPALGQRSLAGLVGQVVFALVLLPTLAGALHALAMDAVTRPVSLLLDNVAALIPRLVSAAIILVLAALIGRAVASVVSGVLAGLGANQWPARLGWRADFNPGGRTMAELIGAAAMAAVMLVALAQASQVLGFAQLTEAVATLGGVLARVAVAVLLMGLGLWLAQLAAQMVLASGAPLALGLSRVVRALVLFFSGALALRQAGLPAEIVTIAFAAVVGALALGVAIAMGVGGRHVAAKLADRALQAFDRSARHEEPKND